MRLFFLTFLFIIACKSRINHEYQGAYHGTLIIMACGTDGIIIAADSRLVQVGLNSNQERSVLGYIDSCQKIYKVKNILVAFANAREIAGRKDLELSRIVKNYNNWSGGAGWDNKRVFNNFAHSIQGAIRDIGLHKIAPIYLYSGGYLHDTAILHYFRIDNPDTLFGNSLIDSIYFSEPAEDIFRKISPKGYKGLSCKQLLPLLDSTIREYGINHNSVGGVASIAMIKKDNTIVWLQNELLPDKGVIYHYVSPFDTVWKNEIR